MLVVYIIGNLYLSYVFGKKIDSAEDFYLGRLTIRWKETDKSPKSRDRGNQNVNRKVYM